MFSKYNKEFKEILSLALLKEIAYNQEAKDGIHNFDLSDMIDYLEKSKNLKSKKR